MKSGNIRKSITGILIAAAVAFGFDRLLRANAPHVPSNTWAATGDMASGRAGASAALLWDGRVLVTGGATDEGVSASAEQYSVSAENFFSTPPMQTPRANHTSTLLPDGRVLIAGGMGADGRALSTTETYDPATNAWTPAATMYYARSGQTATALSDGPNQIALAELPPLITQLQQIHALLS